MSQAFISPRDFAICTLVDALELRLAAAAPLVAEAQAALARDSVNGAIGAMVPLRSQLADAQTLLDAAFALHRSSCP